MLSHLTITQFISRYLGPTNLPGDHDWKFNNTLLNDVQYVSKVRDTYAHACRYYSHVTDKRLFWELMKTEITSATISFSKSKAKCISSREQELRRRIDQLDFIICDNFSSPTSMEYYGSMTDWKRNLNQFTKKKENKQCWEQNAAG